MAPQTKRKKASKGSGQIKAAHERLQFVFSFNGRRRYLSLGIADRKTARALAEMKAKQIQLNILSGNFDETLAKYKPQAAVSANEPAPPESLPKLKESGPALNEL